MTLLKLKVKKVKRQYPGDIERMGYATRVISNGNADVDDVATEACHNTTLHPAEAKIALELCMESAAKLLKQGFIVDLGPIGRLYPSCQGGWASDPDALKLSQVKPSVYYHPSEEVKAAVAGAKLTWVKADGTEEDEDADNPGGNDDNDEGITE